MRPALTWLGLWLGSTAWTGSARAAEVVWRTPPADPSVAAAAASQAGATRPPLDLVDLRSAPTAWTDADEQALRDLGKVVGDVRAYEDDLDGELLILRDLDGALARVSALRDETDRQQVSDALLYQGFAADRYFGDALATASAAGPYRAEVAGITVARPWRDAAALEPGKDASPYQIAEAPQRIAYNAVRARLDALLPATLTPVDAPPGATLVVDGRPAPLGPSGNVKVRPGRHLVHLALGERIVARWTVDVAPAGDAPLVPTVGETEWQRFLADPSQVTGGIAACIAALGGEVWLLDAEGHGVAVRADAGGGLPQDVVVDRSAPPIARSGASSARARGSIGVLGGWLSSGDFYAQDPTAPRTKATVNAATVGGWAEGGAGVGLARVGAGADVAVPLGPDHVALSGARVVRVRPVPYVAAGIGPVDVAAGFLFPYHPAVGGHLTLATRSGGPALVLRVAAWAGLAVPQRRDDGTRWSGHPVYTVDSGLGLGF